VARQLSAKGFSVFLPEMGVSSRTLTDRSRIVPAPMFPGYLFVRQAMEKRSYLEMLKVRGIVKILEDGWTRLTPVPDGEVDVIHRIVDARVPVSPHPHLSAGDLVQLVGGPLAGLEGFFVQDKGHRGRVVVSIGLLGRGVAVEVDGNGVTAVRANR
jgi:transcription antitermination factor NusG